MYKKMIIVSRFLLLISWSHIFVWAAAPPPWPDASAAAEEVRGFVAHSPSPLLAPPPIAALPSSSSASPLGAPPTPTADLALPDPSLCPWPSDHCVVACRFLWTAAGNLSFGVATWNCEAQELFLRSMDTRLRSFMPEFMPVTRRRLEALYGIIRTHITPTAHICCFQEADPDIWAMACQILSTNTPHFRHRYQPSVKFAAETPSFHGLGVATGSVFELTEEDFYPHLIPHSHRSLVTIATIPGRGHRLGIANVHLQVDVDRRNEDVAALVAKVNHYARTGVRTWVICGDFNLDFRNDAHKTEINEICTKLSTTLTTACGGEQKTVRYVVPGVGMRTQVDPTDRSAHFLDYILYTEDLTPVADSGNIFGTPEESITWRRNMQARATAALAAASRSAEMTTRRRVTSVGESGRGSGGSPVQKLPAIGQGGGRGGGGGGGASPTQHQDTTTLQGAINCANVEAVNQFLRMSKVENTAELLALAQDQLRKASNPQSTKRTTAREKLPERIANLTTIIAALERYTPPNPAASAAAAAAASPRTPTPPPPATLPQYPSPLRPAGAPPGPSAFKKPSPERPGSKHPSAPTSPVSKAPGDAARRIDFGGTEGFQGSELPVLPPSPANHDDFYVPSSPS